MAVDNRDPVIDVIRAAGHQRAVRKQNPPVETPRTGKDSADVIGVFMRNQNRIDILAREIQACQPARDFARSETGIDQHPCISAFDQQGIALAAAAE